MGQLMQDDDIFIGSLLETLSLRFAPPNGSDPEYFGGIDEMVALQKEFEVFKVGRSFRDSAAVLNVGGLLNPRARNRWYKLLSELNLYESNVAGENGDVAIVNALIANLSSAKPSPVHFTAHDSRTPDGKRVLVGHNPTPLFYLTQRYLAISLPMKPRY